MRVERDSTQRLWRFPTDGSAPSLVLRDVKPVGYFAWLDSVTLALFVLGNPNTLQIADTRTGVARVVTSNIGRSLQRVPGGRRASFVQRDGATWILKTVDPTPRADGGWAWDTNSANAFRVAPFRFLDIRDPSIQTAAVSVFKNTRLAGDKTLQLRFELFNPFNTRYYGGPNTTITSTQFGKIMIGQFSPVE